MEVVNQRYCSGGEEVVAGGAEVRGMVLYDDEERWGDVDCRYGVWRVVPLVWAASGGVGCSAWLRAVGRVGGKSMSRHIGL